MAVAFICQSENDRLIDLLRRAQQILNTKLIPMNKINWGELKVELEGLPESQLVMLLTLVEQMKAFCEADQEKASLSRNRWKTYVYPM